jgi:alkanesulfonate monooxygenase SsuD/methylene tetrahydromethanopterin reductase-like flavin-dependent oxidoreductase (luciferase family)
MRGPVEHVDPPGYQSPTASRLAARRIGGAGAPPASYEDLQEVGAIVVGSPDTVTKKLSGMIEELNPGYMILIGSDGNIPHSDVMRSVELLGREVVPALHEIQLTPYE